MTTTDPTPQAPPYVPGRPIMTSAELAGHKVESYGRDYSESDDGWSDMEVERGRGWQPLAGWGADGWDLGEWPYVAYSVRNTDGHGRPAYQLMETVEGDRTVWEFPTQQDRAAAIDLVFILHGLGCEYDEWAVEGLTPDKRAGIQSGTVRVPDRLRGPYRH